MTKRESKSLGAPDDLVNEPPREWLAGFLERVTRGGSLRPVWNDLAERTLTEGAARQVVFFALPDQGESLRVLGAAGFDQPRDRTDLLDLCRRLGSWSLKTRLPLKVSSLEEDSRFACPVDGLQWAWAFPLRDHDEFSGVLVGLGESAVAPVHGAADLTAELAALILSWARYRKTAGHLAEDLMESERLRSRAERRAGVADLVVDMAPEVKATLSGLNRQASDLGSGSGEEGREESRRLLEQGLVRLDRLLHEQIQVAELPEPELAPEDLNQILTACLALVETEAKSAGVRISHRLARSLPSLLLDLQLFRQIVLNMLRTGLEQAPPGSRMRVESKRRGEVVEVFVAADRRREPGATLEELWAPFGSNRARLAASAVERVLREHQGVLRVSATRDWPLVFSLTLPLVGNQNRRKGLDDRRRPRKSA